MKKKKNNLKKRLVGVLLATMLIATILVPISMGMDEIKQPGQKMMNSRVHDMRDFINDVGVTAINNPPSEIHPGEYEVQATVENYGGFDLYDVPIHCEIAEQVTYIDEDFSTSVPPFGWTQEESYEWIQFFSGQMAGGISPEARLYGHNIYDSYAYLQTGYLCTSEATHLQLNFRSYIPDNYDDGGYYCRVLTRADGADSWTDVTPWNNPVSGDIGPEMHSLDISHDLGEATQIRFEYQRPAGAGYIASWYLDDVQLIGGLFPIVYESNVTVDIAPFSSVLTNFSSSWDAQEGTYITTVESELENDSNPTNNKMQKTINIDNLLDDVGISTINYPLQDISSGDCPIVFTVENYGICDQTSVNIYCEIQEQLSGEIIFTTNQYLYNLMSGSTKDVQFSIHWDAIPGDYTVSVTTNLAGDENTSNDQFITSSTVHSWVLSPFNQDRYLQVNAQSDWAGSDSCYSTALGYGPFSDSKLINLGECPKAYASQDSEMTANALQGGGDSEAHGFYHWSTGGYEGQATSHFEVSFDLLSTTSIDLVGYIVASYTPGGKIGGSPKRDPKARSSIKLIKLDATPSVTIVDYLVEAGTYPYSSHESETIDDQLFLETGRYKFIATTYAQASGHFEVSRDSSNGMFSFSMTTVILGDVNGDGFVDVLDLLEVVSHWGELGGPADVNGDGIVDVLDLLVVINNWS